MGSSVVPESHTSVPQSSGWADVSGLLARLHSDAKLSPCLVEGIAIAQKIHQPELQAFCEAEVVTSIKDAKNRTWRKLQSYKFPVSLSPPYCSNGRNENFLLAAFAAQNGLTTSPDFWFQSVSDTEHFLDHVDEQERSGKVSLCIKEMPAKFYSSDPAAAGVKFTVIFPSSELRIVMRRTREEFVRQLLAILKSLPVPSSPAAPSRLRQMIKRVVVSSSIWLWTKVLLAVLALVLIALVNRYATRWDFIRSLLHPQNMQTDQSKFPSSTRS